jgi:hypothetical protein
VLVCLLAVLVDHCVALLDDVRALSVTGHPVPPYSPNCVECMFSDVQMHDPA